MISSTTVIKAKNIPHVTPFKTQQLNIQIRTKTCEVILPG